MVEGFTNNKAITAAVVAIASAVLGIIVAAGLPLSKELTSSIIQAVTVITPVALVFIGWLHHHHISYLNGQAHADAIKSSAAQAATAFDSAHAAGRV
jgi:protein-S-isoprenylcysteine O-methyltransferase Ste14